MCHRFVLEKEGADEETDSLPSQDQVSGFQHPSFGYSQNISLSDKPLLPQIIVETKTDLEMFGWVEHSLHCFIAFQWTIIR